MTAHATALVRQDCVSLLEGRAQQLTPLKGDTLLVTGGTGFLGTWLAEVVTALNDEFGFGTQLVLVARGTDHFRASRPHLASRADVRLVKSDVRHLLELPKETNWVVHAAANPDNRFHASSPIDTMSIIADGTSAVLRAVDRCSKFKMLLNVSSALIYGKQPFDQPRLAESDGGAPPCASASSVYAEAKRYGETFCAAARSQARIPVVTARPFAFLGPYQAIDTPWAINNFINDGLHDNAIRVQGDGQTVRSYLYASDLAFWCLRALTKGAPGAVFNVGSAEEITLEKLAGLVSNHFSPRPEVRLRTGQGPAQPSRMVPDVSAAERTLGLSQTVPLSAAIERTILWNKAQRS